METEMSNGEEASSFKYLIFRPEKCGVRDVFGWLVWSDGSAGERRRRLLGFVESSDDEVLEGMMSKEQRWVIVISIIIRKLIGVVGKPMEWTGYLVDYLLNLLSENGQLLGLIYNLLRGKVVMPQRNSETFISTIGHLDGRVDLYKVKGDSFNNIGPPMDAHALLAGEDGSDNGIQIQDHSLMDLCMMASKLAYENVNFIRNIVHNHWKMHFVDFFNGWNDFQKERSTQVFIFCDKLRDASLILISFRGTEPFDADDWSTDFDYSWCEIPKLGKIHMGFLEALGLGNRDNVSTFQKHLQFGAYNLKATMQNSKVTSSNGTNVMTYPSECTESFTHSDSERKLHPSDTEESTDEKEFLPEMLEVTAYYAVRSKLKSLLDEHKNAKFIVTGHSLGGALAILFPTVLLLHEEKEMMQRLLGVYTFGQPRVGDRALGRFMEAHLNRPTTKYFRLVYCNDLVPRLPYDDKTFLYKHFGLCLYYDSMYNEQKVNEEPNRNYFGIRYLILEYLNAGWELIRGLTMGCTHGEEYKEGWFSIFLRVLGLALPGISAHCLRDYINSVRLGRERVHMSSI